MVSKYASSRLFQYFALLILLLLSVVFHVITKFSFKKVILPTNRPEYLAFGLVGRLFNSAGKAKYKLNSATVIKYPNISRIVLADFVVDVYNESNDDIAYKLAAKQGWYDYKTFKGYLGQQAKLTFINESNIDQESGMIINSSNIDIDLKQHLEHSSNGVSITWGKNTINATGFVYNDSQQIIYLESNVRITYAQ